MTSGRASLLFVAKCLAFSLIFWTVWHVMQTFTGASPAARERGQAAHAAAYETQAARVDRQLDNVDLQQKRMDAILRGQEQSMARFGKVLDGWERAPATRK